MASSSATPEDSEFVDALEYPDEDVTVDRDSREKNLKPLSDWFARWLKAGDAPHVATNKPTNQTAASGSLDLHQRESKSAAAEESLKPASGNPALSASGYPGTATSARANILNQGQLMSSPPSTPNDPILDSGRSAFYFKSNESDRSGSEISSLHCGDLDPKSLWSPSESSRSASERSSGEMSETQKEAMDRFIKRFG